MFNDTHSTRGQTSPQIGQRWQQKLCHCKRRKDLGFPAFPDVASKICIVCSAYLSKEERLFFDGVLARQSQQQPPPSWDFTLISCSSLFIQPEPLPPALLGSLVRCQLSRPFKWHIRHPRYFPPSPLLRLQVLQGWTQSLADLVLLPAATTGFVRGGRLNRRRPFGFSVCYKSKLSVAGK